jgi:hypothetical protein
MMSPLAVQGHLPVGTLWHPLGVLTLMTEKRMPVPLGPQHPPYCVAQYHKARCYKNRLVHQTSPIFMLESYFFSAFKSTRDASSITLIITQSAARVCTGLRPPISSLKSADSSMAEVSWTCRDARQRRRCRI